MYQKIRNFTKEGKSPSERQRRKYQLVVQRALLPLTGCFPVGLMDLYGRRTRSLQRGEAGCKASLK